MQLRLSEIAAFCKGKLCGEGSKTVTAITLDSRQVQPGSMYVAVKGARVDGHKFVPSAFESGAVCVLVEEVPECQGDYILVDSTLQAIKDIAEGYRQTLQAKVVGITGSVGKTSTKEMIASVLEQKFQVTKTLGNFNNEIGVPLTVFRVKEEDEIAILEMGISDFGEMSRLTKIARPDICVITNIGQCHLENLGDRDGVLKAKTEIFQGMKPGGVAVLNGDDDKLLTVKEVQGSLPQFFGHENNGTNQVFVKQVEDLGLEGTRLTMGFSDGGELTAHIPVAGEHMVSNAMAAALVGKNLGLTLEEIKAGIESYQTIAGRNHTIKTEKYTILDDCYNANPMSMKASIDIINKSKGRKVAVLGDMFELGENEKELHRQVGEYAGNSALDVLICAGERCNYMAEAAKTCGKKEVYHFADRDEIIANIDRLLQPGDTIVIKASHSMGFEKIVEYLTK